MVVLLLLVATGMLGACARGDRPGLEPAGTSATGLLVGGWVLEGEACASDGGVIYTGDGQWHSDGASGTWAIHGDRLVQLVTEEEDGSGRMRSLDPPERHVDTIEMLGADRFVARRTNGSERRFVRCAAG